MNCDEMWWSINGGGNCEVEKDYYNSYVSSKTAKIRRFFTCNVNIHFEFIWCLSFLFADSVDKKIDKLSCQVKPNNATIVRLLYWYGMVRFSFASWTVRVNRILSGLLEICVSSQHNGTKSFGKQPKNVQTPDHFKQNVFETIVFFSFTNDEIRKM